MELESFLENEETFGFIQSTLEELEQFVQSAYAFLIVRRHMITPVSMCIGTWRRVTGSVSS